MKSISLDYHHQRGTHCITTAMMNLFNHFGIELSEEICFGLGGGLGFTYARGRDMDQFMVFGRSDDLELNICEILGVHAILKQEHNSEKALQSIISLLERGEPVLVDLDTSRLSYLSRTLDWPEYATHGGHKAVITGYEEVTRTLEVYDYIWGTPRSLPVEDLFKAWKTYSGISPASNLWYEFTVPNTFVDLDQALRKGIYLNVYRMLTPWNKFHGIDAMRSFLREVPNWPYLMNEEKRKKLAFSSYIALEIGGTGKSAFRRMFSRFLKQAGHILDEPQLINVGEQYREISLLWTELAERIRVGSIDPNEGIFSGSPDNEQLTDEIYKREYEQFQKLHNLSSSWL
ncbi:BtrH N-terminal domain-containing protein [Metabacillus halosaccharovorans]|uniref:BtrH N-terminal domain-containing protein n=1 Tax=Metabacillus halosaccharovorans TaxID=930124 RepID=UPI00403DE7AC